MNTLEKFELFLREFADELVLFGDDGKRENEDGMYISGYSLKDFFEDFDSQSVEHNEYDIYMLDYLNRAFLNEDLPEEDLFIGTINSDTDDIEFSEDFKELDLKDLGFILED